MMNQFTNEMLKISVGQISQTIGFHGIYSTPLDVLCDLLHRYLTEVCRLTHRYTEHFGRSEPNLDDLGLAFLDMGISVSELEEYVNNVDCSPFPHLLPSLPVPRTSNLNFLKPGAREILSRPIHIHEHLPPMYPEKEEEELDVKVSPSLDEAMGDGSSPTSSPQPAIKRSSDSDISPAKKAKYSLDDEGQPVREIVSVMMTTSGFISSAREGKLPEARCPNIPMATPRCSSPSVAAAAGKKKLTVEKLIRQKNNQGIIVRSMPNKPPRPLKVKVKDKSGNKGLKIPKMPPSRPSSHSQTGNPSIPGASPLPPKLKMPTPKVSGPKIPPSKPPTSKVSTSNSTVTKASPPKMSTPKVSTPKTSTPKIKVPKPPKTSKSEAKKPSTPKSKDVGKECDPKKIKKEKEPGKKNKESKKEKDPMKLKENKKEKECRKEKEAKKEKEIKKEKENKKEKERERELIMALASSSAVTVTSIPAPNKSQDLSLQEKAEGKSKLSIFKKINKVKDIKDQDRSGERDAQQSRDSSPDLMIDETPSRIGQRRPPEDLNIMDNPNRRLDTTVDDMVRSPGDFSSYQDDLSPPGTPSTPRTPEIPHMPIHKTPEKRKGKEKIKEKRPRKDRSKSPKCGFSPGHREVCEFETPERPKTPEVGLPLEDLVGPSTAPFSIPPFPTAPGFIPPFSRFPFIHPFSGPPHRPGLPHPPMPDLRLHPHPFLPRPPIKRQLEDDHLSSLDDPENLERPLTPRHTRDSSPLPITSHSSPLRSPSPIQLPATPPRPRTPAHHSPPPMPRIKPERLDKSDKEKKKEHKKDKKEKEKEKEKDKVKKKKDKKDKEKEKEKSDKKKEKEKTKQDKKEKKIKKEKDEGSSVPRITMKLPSTTGSSPPCPGTSRPMDTTATPKLVIKPVVKHEDDVPVTKPPPTSSGSHDDQPGSPEIAKFSALITRPPRSQQKKGESPPVVPVLKIKDVQNPIVKQKEGKDQGHSQTKAKEVKEVPPLKIRNPTTTTPKPQATPKLPPLSKPLTTSKQSATTKLPTTAKPLSMPKPPTMSKLSEEKKTPGNKKVREKKEKKEKKSKDVPQALATSVPPTVGPNSTAVSGTSGGGADLSFPGQMVPASVPIISPPPDTPKSSKKQEIKSTGLLTETVGPIGHFVDDQGNEVWICPTCGKQDDGSPMIGCDTCDDWYHWVCVGIQVPPNDDVNWYCPRCLSQHKQRGPPPEKKKRGRKKK